MVDYGPDRQNSILNFKIDKPGLTLSTSVYQSKDYREGIRIGH